MNVKNHTTKENSLLAILKAASLAVILSFGALSLSACDNDGPLEEAGEKLDRAGDDLGDAARDATDELEDAADELN